MVAFVPPQRAVILLLLNLLLNQGMPCIFRIESFASSVFLPALGFCTALG